MLNLSDQERQEVQRYLDENRPLPDKYRFLLFDNNRKAELIWEGKTDAVCDTVLPFQTTEIIGDSCGKDWSNKLIWGDNKLILSSLKNGPLRHEIEAQGGIKLIYIDPPFDVGADFSADLGIGNNDPRGRLERIEEIAYRDTWGDGEDSFLNMIRERLILMHELLAEDGGIYVHLDYRMAPCVNIILSEIFGKSCQVNEIIWSYKTGGMPEKLGWGRKHDNLLFFVKDSEKSIWNPQKEKSYLKHKYGFSNVEIFSDDLGQYTVVNCRDVFEIPALRGNQAERVSYPTQKPEALLERIIRASSNRGDLIADFFCGSGTTAAVAEKLGRKWIAADLGKLAIHTTRKRMIGVQRQLKEEGSDYRAFEILNIGRYERAHYIGVNPNLSEEEQQAQLLQKENDFLSLILKAYQAESVSGFGCFQGQRLGRLVAIGPVALPISRSFIEGIIKKCLEYNIKKIDLLGFEFETGLFPKVLDYASSNGIEIVPKYIPSEVLDKRAVDKGQVVFHNVAYVEAEPLVSNGTLSVKLTGFTVIHSLDSDAYECTALGSSKRSLKRTVMENGKVVKISKGNGGETEREVLTKHWSDWVDYWSVDFNYKTDEDNPASKGNQVFKSEWQSFRTRRERSLELTAATHEVSCGPRKIAIQVIDIFGNSTMAIIDMVI